MTGLLFAVGVGGAMLQQAVALSRRYEHCASVAPSKTGFPHFVAMR
jgi:hypothetical protein